MPIEKQESILVAGFMVEVRLKDAKIWTLRKWLQ